MKASEIIKVLENKIELLKKLEEESVSGFAIIIPPSGNPIEMMSLDSTSDERMFYESMSKKCIDAKDQNSLGGVTVPYGRMRA